MSRIRIIYENLADSGTLTASSAAATLPVGNLRTERKSQVWRTNGATTATLTLALTTERLVSGVALAFSNLTSEATMRVRARVDGADIADTGHRQCCPYQPLGLWGWGEQPLGVNAFAYGIAPYGVIWLDEPTGADEVIIEVADPDNPAGYIEASRLVVGAHWSPRFNAVYGATWALVEHGQRAERTESGDLVAEVTPRRRRLSLDLARLPPEDRLQITGMLQQVGTSRPFFISVFPGRANDPGLEQNYQLWGHLPDAVELRHASFRAHSTALTIEEL